MVCVLAQTVQNKQLLSNCDLSLGLAVPQLHHNRECVKRLIDCSIYPLTDLLWLQLHAFNEAEVLHSAAVEFQLENVTQRLTTQLIKFCLLFIPITVKYI